MSSYFEVTLRSKTCVIENDCDVRIESSDAGTENCKPASSFQAVDFIGVKSVLISNERKDEKEGIVCDGVNDTLNAWMWCML